MDGKIVFKKQETIRLKDLIIFFAKKNLMPVYSNDKNHPGKMTFVNTIIKTLLSIH